MDLEDLDQKLKKMIDSFPDARKALVEKCGEKMHQAVLNNINAKKDGTGNLKRGVTKVIGSRGGYSAVKPDYKIAPHSNLLENGHKLIKDGKVVGWVSGKHMYRNALNSLINQLEQDAEKMLDELVGEFDG